jgi:hypothetical protein
MSDANFFSSKIVLFYKRFTSKFKQIFYFYKTVHDSVYSKVLGEVLRFCSPLPTLWYCLSSSYKESKEVLKSSDTYFTKRDEKSTDN